MTLDEMETEHTAKAQRDADLRALNDKLAQRWLGEHNQVAPVVTRSLYCQRNNHGRCNWAECKCVCHDVPMDWCGHC